ncbi:MAG: hypothetical protein HY716_15725 [Planctomycetes bacterium]|nr:hypothetical protein [Planctomycetota bacterium]
MRAGALSNAKVGAYLRERAVATWKRVGTFTAIQRNGKTIARQGGNVATYFCTPDLEVIHAVAGPVNANSFLREATWACETYERLLKESNGDREALAKGLAEAHRKKAYPPSLRSYLCRSVPAGASAWHSPSLAHHVQKANQHYAEAHNVRDTVASEGEWNYFTSSCVELQSIEALSAVQYVLGSCQDTNKSDESPAARSWVVQSCPVETTLFTLVAGGGSSLHGYLADRLLAKLDDVYTHVFERVLGQRVTDQPVRLREVMRVRAAGCDHGDLIKKIESLQKQVEELQKRLGGTRADF